MKTRKIRFLPLIAGPVLAAGLWIATSPAVLAQVVAPDQAKQADETLSATAGAPAAPRTTATGSNIVRVRKDPALPLLVLDRGYIDQSAATTSTELIQTVPQAQNFRAPALTAASRH
jgi:hypothetical protein